MPKLGVNIDHVATVRQARKTFEPDPVWAAAAAQLGGADGITLHLREDRRHILDRDVRLLKETVSIKLNLECACVPEMLDIALATEPSEVLMVPEKRQEVTTEGGLDVVGNPSEIGDAIRRLQDVGIMVSLFIDPDSAQIDMSKELGADAVELHTGPYASESQTYSVRKQNHQEYQRLLDASKRVVESGLRLHAGHGLTYNNVREIAFIPGVKELNIGHSIVARSIFVGMTEAVREMKRLVTLPSE